MSQQNGGKAAGVANSVIDALRAQPLMLALIVLVAIFFYFSWQGISTQRAQTHEILKVLLDRCGRGGPTNAHRHLQAEPLKEGDQ